MFAKTQEIKAALQEKWADVEKLDGIVEGHPEAKHGTVSNYLIESKAMKMHSCHHAVEGAQLATTHYRVLESTSDLALVS